MRAGLGATPGPDQQVFKLLFTAAIIVGVWYLFKGKSQVSHRTMSKLGRAFGAARRAMSESAESRREAEQGPPSPKSRLPVELKPCPRCGTYIAVGTTCTCTKS